MLSGFKLKMLRLHKQIKQQDIADYCKKSKNYISMIENQKCNITDEMYQKYVEALNGGVAKMLKEKLEQESNKLEKEIRENEETVKQQAKKATTKKTKK